ncbi:hypothetical protein ACSNOI_24200 [Actinomadura kijaniata]|uniref:hypothetical protein n=1 Tax=Actinomadura kijaniata TaxID=46161 RepID=UPI003F1CD4BB
MLVPVASASVVADVVPACATIVTACGFLVALRALTRDVRRAGIRLRGEREEAERRLREEDARARDRHGRDLLVDQLRRVGDLYAEYLAAEETLAMGRKTLALHRLQVHLPVVPGRYCSLLKLRFDIGQSSESEREAARRFALHDRLPSPELVSPQWIYQEFGENLRELMGITPPAPRRPARPSGGASLVGMLRRLGRPRIDDSM